MSLIRLYREKSVPWEPKEYQVKGVEWLLKNGAAALFADPGLGKTSMTLAAVKALLSTRQIHKVLVIAPLRVCYEVWPKEVEKWSEFSHLRVSVLHGKNKGAALLEDADIYVINPAGLPWLLREGWWSQNLEAPDVLVIDELSAFKHTNTKRFKLLKRVLPEFRRRWGLTGSPAANGLMDLFGQCYALDLGRSLGRFITHYRRQYFYPHPSGFGWVLRPGSETQIYERLAPLVMRMSADDCLDMPDVIENNIRVSLTESASKTYHRLEKDLIAQIADHTVLAHNVAAATTKCRQIANGGVYIESDQGGEWAEVHGAKIEALRDLVSELQGSPLLVAYDFCHDLERIRHHMPNTPYIGSGVSPARTADIVRAWNAGEIPVLLGHPQSIGHGLNLQGSGQHVCWFSLTWNYELYDQFIRRVHRQGNKHKRVFVHHIIARGTIDEVVLKALKSKRRGQNALFDALRESIGG